MKQIDTPDILIEKFKNYLGGMKEIITNKEPVVSKGEEKISVRVFTNVGDNANPLEKVFFMTLENGWVKNNNDGHLLDSTEFTVSSFIPSDTWPLPICCLEASFHFNKYLHCTADIFPASRNPEYREIYCKPVQELRRKHTDIPGLFVAGKTLLKDYTSGGQMAGDLDWKSNNISIPWFFEYADLYLRFLNEREQHTILREPSIRGEALQTKSSFLNMFRAASPRILSDVPNLYSDEAAAKLAEMTF
jgi:hypothetical protein